MGVTDLLLLSCLGFAITAHAQDCARPAGGPNMHLKDEYILKETFADGDRAVFTCDVGYISAGGSSSITCTAGSWNTVTLKCDRRNCGSPGEVLNGQIHYPQENLFGDRIEITCDEGYRLVGKSTITCGAEGWMGRLPRCEVATCDEAPQVKDATFTPYKDPYNYGDVVRYTCQNGLTLNGSASIECSDDGTFKPDPPTCHRVQCEDLDIPNLVWVSGSRPPHGYKARLTYRCITGYRIVGQSTLTCDINSQWSPGLPRCEEIPPVPTEKPAIPCDSPFIKHGYLTVVDQPHYRVVVVVKCQWFYNIEGESTLTCDAAGRWSHSPPTCALSGGKVACVVIVAIIVVIIIYIILICCGIVPAPFGIKRRQKRLKECETNDQEGKSLPDGVGLMETRKGHGQTANEKSPVVSSDKV
ncbi:membrane cofactor protein-like isoform 4-T4 [Acanthopagrus schlegelii]